MTPSHSSSRESLGFVRVVRDVVGPVAAELGLQEVSSDLYSVVYEGARGRLDVVHEPASYELDIAFWPGEQTIDRPYGIADFIRITDPEQARRSRAFAAVTPDGVRHGVERLTRDLERYGVPVLTSGGRGISQLEKGRQAAIAEFNAMHAHARDERTAAEAVRQRDWDTVIALYEAREDELNRVQRRRLDLARRRRAGG